MKPLTSLALSVPILSLFIAMVGCGGGGDSGRSAPVVVTGAQFQGIWVGSSNSTTVGGTGKSELEVELTNSGGTLAGVARLTVGYVPYTGTVTGTAVTAASGNLTINLGSFGTVTSIVTNSNGVISGTFTRSNSSATIESGTVSLTKSAVTADASISGTYAGTSLSHAVGATATQTSFTVSQTGENVQLSNISSWFNSGAVPGVIIGNVLTFTLVTPGTGFINYVTGIVSGSTITGTYFTPGSDPGNDGIPSTGTWTASDTVNVDALATGH